jgi:hypothetical protein
MLVKKESLRVLLSENMTSDGVLEFVWKKKGNIFSLIPESDFKRCRWVDLVDEEYAVMSYQWKSSLKVITEFIFGADGIQLDWIWFDLLCLNQLNGNRITTVKKSDEIYHHAKEYHLMEVGSLNRGWVLFELSSVRDDIVPKTHFIRADKKMLITTKAMLKRDGFEGSKFTKPSDKDLVRKKILEKFQGDMVAFNNRIETIVDNLI